MTICSIVSTKGGVGKTVTTVHLGAALAEAGYPTLLIDVDLQHGLTSYFDLSGDGLSTSDVLCANAELADATVRVRDNLFVLPATAAMEQAEVTLTAKGGGELMLRRAFRRLEKVQPWTFVLIDCPSGWGAVTRNALLASENMIIPINSEPAAVTNAAATESAARELAEIHDHKLTLSGVLLTRWRVERASSAVSAQVEDYWGNKVFQTRIRQSAKVNELAIHSATMTDVSKGHAGVVREDYHALAQEVIERCLSTKVKTTRLARTKT